MGIFSFLFGSKPQRQPQSAEEKALAEIGAKNWNFFAENYAGLPSQLLRALAPERDMPRVTSEVAAGVRAGTRDRGQRALGLATSLLGERQGLARALPAAIQGLHERELRAALAAAQAARGGQALAIQGMGDLARDAIRVASARMAYDTARSQFLPNVLGAGLGAAAGGLYVSDRIRNPFAPGGG